MTTLNNKPMIALLAVVAMTIACWSTEAVADPAPYAGILTVSAEAKGETASNASAKVDSEAPAATPVSAVTLASRIVIKSALEARERTPNRIFRFGVDLSDSNSGSVFSSID